MDVFDKLSVYIYIYIYIYIDTLLSKGDMTFSS